MEMKIILLEDGEYHKEITKKDTIYLHHTAGSHRPDYSINGWETDKNKAGGQLAVATSYLIGGISTTDRNADWDGVIVKAFDDKYWAHHLGTTAANNKVLNQKSVAIEICNYGPLTKTKDGIFLNYVNKPVPADMVEELAVPFRGYKYYHKYTKKQMATVRALMEDIATRHGINMKAGLRELFMRQGISALELQADALAGKPGVWSHTNVIGGKFDLNPQTAVLDLIKSL